MPTCYRHPDREAGIVCQRCDRPICPQCMHQASVGFHCPECTKKGAQKVYQGVGALRVRPIVTQVLVGLNVVVFLIGAALSGEAADYFGGSLTQFQVDFGAMAKLWERADGLYTGPVLGSEAIGVGAGEWYRLVTSGFLHYGVFHILVNMWALWVLGQALEQYGGRIRFGVIYGVSLLAGSFGAVLLSPQSVAAGASGAIFGLMGALFLVFRAQGVPWRNSPLLNILVLNLVITFAIPSISKGAHLGGLAGGLLAGWLLIDVARRPGVGDKVAYGICGAVAVALVVASVVFSTGYQPY